jgi:hypothetical protein
MHGPDWVPVLGTFCSGVVWGPKIFHMGYQNRRHVRSSWQACSDRTKAQQRRAAREAGRAPLDLLLMHKGAQGCYSRPHRGR